MSAEADPLLGAWPYIGRHFEFAERVPGAAPTCAACSTSPSARR